MADKKLPDSVAAIKQSIASGECSSQTVAELRRLLGDDTPVSSRTTYTDSSKIKGPEPARKQPRNVKSKTAVGAQSAAKESRKEKTAPPSQSAQYRLATEVVNASLQSLTAAVKSRAEQRAVNGGLHGATPRKATPLQPLSPNQRSTRPAVSLEKKASSIVPSDQEERKAYNLAVCGSAAFALLRKQHRQETNELDDYMVRLCQGMYSLVSKMLALGLDRVAQRELQTLSEVLGTKQAKKLVSRSTDSKETTDSSGLAELLRLQNLPENPAILDLLILAQIQVLKLAGRSKSSSLAVSALEILLDSSSLMIVSIVEGTGKQRTQGNLAQNHKYSEQVSQAINGLTECLSRGQQATSASTTPSHNAAVLTCGRLLALRLRSRSWLLPGAKVDTDKQLLQPLRSSISPLSKSPISWQRSDHDRLVANIEALILSLKLLPTGVVQETQLCAALAMAYRGLATSAKDVGDYSDARTWMEQCKRNAQLGDMASCTQAAIKCQLATTELQSLSKDTSRPETEQSLSEASESLNGRLQGSQTDIDDLLVTTSSLRKNAMTILLEEAARLKEDSQSPRSPWWRLCRMFIFTMPRFLLRMCEISLQSQKNSQDPSKGQNLQLIGQVAKPVIDAVCALTKSNFVDPDGSDQVFITCLSDCVDLVSNLRDALVTPCHTGSAPSFYVNISNALWMRYLQQRRNAVQLKTLEQLLQKSIGILENRPIEERRDGFLSFKHEKLAALYELSGDVDKSAQQYNIAMLKRIEADQAQQDIKDAAQSTNGKTSAELMNSYLRAQARLDISKGRKFSPSLFADLEGPHRHQLLELQMAVALESLTSQNPISTDGDYYAELYRLWLQSCQPGQPASQLRIQVKLLHGVYFANILLPENVLDNIFSRTACGVSDSVVEHLLSQREIYRIMLRQAGDVSAMKAILTAWAALGKRGEPPLDFLEAVDTVPWLQQLHLTERFLRLYGNAELHVLALQALVALSSSQALYDPVAIATYSTAHGEQLARLGQIPGAGRAFLKAQSILNDHGHTQIPSIIWHISHANFQLSLGNLPKCGHLLLQAMNSIESNWKSIMTDGVSATTKYDLVTAASQWFHQRSILALAEGAHGLAIYCARKSSKLAYRSWSLLERQQTPSDIALRPGERISQDQSEISGSALCVSTKHESLSSVQFWGLVPYLFEHTANLVSLLMRAGLVLEAQHYAEQATRVAKASKSNQYLLYTTVMTADLKLNLGQVDKGRTELEGLHFISKTLTVAEQAIFHLALAKVHHHAGEYDQEAQVLKDTKVLLDSATIENRPSKQADLSIKALETGMEALTVTSYQTSRTSAKPRAPARSKKATLMIKSSATENSIVPADAGSNQQQHLRLHSERLRQSCLLAIRLGDLELAASLLEECVVPIHNLDDTVLHNLCEGEILLRNGESSLARDPVFSLLQESAILLPATLAPSPIEDAGTSGIATKQASAAKGKAGRTRNNPNPTSTSVSKLETSDNDSALSLCSGVLMKAATSVRSGSTTGVSHQLSDLLLRTQLLLSATDVSAFSGQYSPVASAWAFEHGRSIAYLREQASIEADRFLDLSREQTSKLISDLPDFASPEHDAARFQQDFVDIIPQQWTVVSIGMSENQDELRVSRLRSEAKPVTLAIPLHRHNPRDCDEESFGIPEGKAELLDIISLANFSAHDVGDLTQKGAKTAWWEARAALDARLRDLMINIQNMWFGGFRGLLSQHVADRHLLSRFQQNLTNILNKYLPSRKKTGRGVKTAQVELDPQVLELFVGLGEPELHDDIDETLMDLFYFVVDVLQFRGERNAYDEIDFDPMILETVDALTSYHNSYKQIEGLGLAHHTILVLDKSLHSFPWESMPFLEGHAISRLPSLIALRERILAMKEQQALGTGAVRHMFSVDSSHGAYVLDPGSDLSSTQKTFKQPLSALTSWEVTINSPPSESEITGYLKDRSIYLYFGHGSGGQYVRSRAIRKLPRCAVSLLMGCSSVLMTEAGKLESYGTPLTYLHAGAPAVVGTLWDVTDKDIDRYSMQLLKCWGLLAAETPGSPVKKGKGKKIKTERKQVHSPTLEETEPVSLDKAVTEARNSCILRYLNGGAPVVYGIPVTLG